MNVRLSSLAAAGLVSGLLLGTPSLHATSMPPMTIADLVRRSSDIVVGTVTSVTENRQGHMPYVEIEVKVSETIKGPAGATVKLRQVGPQSPGQVEHGRRAIGVMPGMPMYSVGEQVMLFLAPRSSSGFRSTIGLQQGKFHMRAGVVQNGLNNHGLFANVKAVPSTLTAPERAMLATGKGGVAAGTFVGFVKRAVAERWWQQEAR
jgi:hypothetical protein